MRKEAVVGLGLAIIIAAVLGTVAYSLSTGVIFSQPETPPPARTVTVTKTVTAPPPGEAAPAPVGEVRGFTFTVKDSDTPWAFVADGEENPTIRVKVGDTVRIVFENDGVTLHTWTLDANSPSPYDVTTVEVAPGESDTVEFVADRPGTFAYYCAVPGHRELGMVGQIVIEE